MSFRIFSLFLLFSYMTTQMRSEFEGIFMQFLERKWNTTISCIFLLITDINEIVSFYIQIYYIHKRHTAVYVQNKTCANHFCNPGGLYCIHWTTESYFLLHIYNAFSIFVSVYRATYECMKWKKLRDYSYDLNQNIDNCFDMWPNRITSTLLS